MPNPLSISAVIVAGDIDSDVDGDHTITECPDTIARYMAMLASRFDEIIIVAADPADFLAHDALIVRRHEDKQGPLGAVYAGLFAAWYDQALVVHSGMPVVEASMIKGLDEAAEPRFDAVVAAAAGPGPFPAVYHKRCLKILAQLWAKGPAPPTVERFFKHIRIRTIDA